MKIATLTLLISLTSSLSFASTNNYGQFDVSKRLENAIKTKVLETAANHCEGFEVAILSKSDLILMPIGQSFSEDNQDSMKRETFTTFRVSGIGKHLGNKGQSYPQCVLKVNTTVETDESTERIQVEVEGVDLSLSGIAG